MTYEEAKQNILNTHIQFGRSNGKTVFNESLSMAIKAIDKQIPKKPIISIHKYIDSDTKAEGSYNLKHCPCCWENGELGYFDSLIDKDTKYCRRCGQAIDWSE